MDNTTLEPLLHQVERCQCWIKPIGDPNNPPTPGLQFDRSIEQIDFAVQPVGINLDDMLFVYIVGQSKLVYIADCFTPLHKATPEEIAVAQWRERWCWSFKGHNYTRTYGAQWWQYQLKPFDMLKEYRMHNPGDTQNLGGIQHGLDKQRISAGFAQFIIQKIINL